MKLTILILLLVATSVQAEVVQWSKGYTGDCTNPTRREDESILTLAEIARVEYYLDKVNGNLATPELTVLMSGGCRAMFIDTKLVGVGNYYKYAMTVDTEGRKSVASIGTPVTIQKSNPKSPTDIR
jgi:hypothetical protein